jgi:type IV pilus assembly protein PilA
MSSRNRKGFTLIELLIVVVIIGILAAIAIPKFASTKSKAYKTAMIEDLHQLVTAEESYFSDSSYYANYTQLNTGTTRFQGSPNDNAPTITTGAGFWAATITSTQITTTCGTAMNTTNPIVAGTADGTPMCH